MSLVGKIRNRYLQKSIQHRVDSYHQTSSFDDSLVLQLRKFNALWADIKQKIPFYSNLAKAHHLPSQFQDWEEFIRLMPIVNRETIQEFGSEMLDKAQKPDFFSFDRWYNRPTHSIAGLAI